jgi:putative phage-type endonuclease
MKDRTRWLEERRQGIGGSDSPVILGVSPFVTPRELWRQKRGIDPLEQHETPAMLRGTALEPIAADLYARQTGRKVRKSNLTLRHPQHQWMLAHIDRQIVAQDERGPGVLEIKCPGLHVFGRARRKGLPDYYQVQLQHYLAVSGRKWGAFAVFNAERWELVCFDVPRDEELIETIIARDAEFWRAVEEGREPVGNESVRIGDLPPVDPSEVITIDSPAWKEAIERLREAREIASEAESLQEQATATVKSLMEQSGATIAEGCGARIYYKLQLGRETFDRNQLAYEHPELDLSRYIKRGNSFRIFKPYFIGDIVND